ncbi:MAG: MFS transporter [Bdellovibrio sp.]|nr:MFS transporter [Bdellovibrio sp.]
MQHIELKGSSVKKFVPWLVAVAFFMEALDTTILNTAVPVIAKALDVPPLSMKSVLSSYTLSLAVFIPISSWMADRFGTRRVFASAIGIFTLGSLLCGLSHSIHFLVFCRLLQGFGGAMMVPVGRLTLVRTFPKSELVQSMTFVAIPALIGPMLGPLVGGLIVAYSHWRLIFFVNVPIGLLGLFLIERFLPDYRTARTDRFDFAGMILFGAGIALLSYVLEVFGEHTLDSNTVLLILGVGVFFLAAYMVHAQTIARPLLRLELLRIRTLQAAVGGNFFTRLGAGGMPFLLALLYQVGLGLGPVQSGLLILPQPVAALLFRFWVPQVLHFFGYRTLLLINTVFIGVFIMLFSLVTPSTSIFSIIALAGGFGIFSSMQYTCMNTLGYADVLDDDASMASTIMSTVQQLALSFGVAVSSLAAAVFLPDRFHSTQQEMIHGIHKAFLFLGLITILSAVGFLKLKPEDGETLSLHERKHA